MLLRYHTKLITVKTEEISMTRCYSLYRFVTIVTEIFICIAALTRFHPSPWNRVSSQKRREAARAP